MSSLGDMVVTGLQTSSGHCIYKANRLVSALFANHLIVSSV